MLVLLKSSFFLENAILCSGLLCVPLIYVYFRLLFRFCYSGLGRQGFLRCAIYSWPETQCLKRENLNADDWTPISEFCVPSMCFSLCIYLGPNFWCHELLKRETCCYSTIASPVSLISAHFSRSRWHNAFEHGSNIPCWRVMENKCKSVE